MKTSNPVTHTWDQVLLLAGGVQGNATNSRHRGSEDRLDVLVGPLEHLEQKHRRSQWTVWGICCKLRLNLICVLLPWSVWPRTGSSWWGSRRYHSQKPPLSLQPPSLGSLLGEHRSIRSHVIIPLNINNNPVKRQKVDARKLKKKIFNYREKTKIFQLYVLFTDDDC